jgi:hypothetical protein
MNLSNLLPEQDKNIKQHLVWQHDYGEHNAVKPVLRKILDEQDASILEMVALFVNNNPYNLEFFIVFSFDNVSQSYLNQVQALMSNVGSRLRADLTFQELFMALGKSRFNLKTLVESSDLKFMFDDLFAFKERLEIAQRISSKPLGKESPVFISHSSKDKPIIEDLIPYMTSAGLPIWYDKINIDYGQSIVEAVQEGVGMSKAVIFWITKNFLESSWCKTEMRNFLNRHSGGDNVRIISVVSDDVGKEDIPIFMQELKYLRLEKDMNLANVAKEILPTLKRHFER